MAYTITALKVQKRNPNRVSVYLDGEYAFGLARIVAAWLTVDQTLSDEEIKTLQAKDTDETAFLAALRFLNYRARTEVEVKKKLFEKGYSEVVIEQTLERLRRGNLLDDAQFAQAWVENQTTFRPRGRRALAFELRHKGVSDELIQQTLGEMTDEETLAYQAAMRQERKWAGLEWKDFRVKVGQFLARRGFSYGTIAPVVTRLWAELESAHAQQQSDNATDIEEEEDGQLNMDNT